MSLAHAIDARNTRERVTPGGRLALDNGGISGPYGYADAAPDTTPAGLRKMNPACPRCFLAHAGECV